MLKRCLPLRKTGNLGGGTEIFSVRFGCKTEDLGGGTENVRALADCKTKDLADGAKNPGVGTGFKPEDVCGSPRERHRRLWCGCALRICVSPPQILVMLVA